MGFAEDVAYLLPSPLKGAEGHFGFKHYAVPASQYYRTKVFVTEMRIEPSPLSLLLCLIVDFSLLFVPIGLIFSYFCQFTILRFCFVVECRKALLLRLHSFLGLAR